MKDLDRAIADRAVALGLLDRDTLESYRRLVEDRRERGDRVYLSQVLVRERILEPQDLLRLQDEVEAPVYECPKCQQKHAAPDVGRPGEKFTCKGCGRKVRLLERDHALTQIEVLASKDPRDLTIPLRLASETASATRVGDFDLERYEVEGELGRGGYGVVFKARHKDLDRLVALKVIRTTADLDPTALERFIREGRAASRLSHPNVCQVYDIGRHKDLLALAMELVPGQALRDVIKEGALPWRRACEVLQGILAGLQCAHENGIIHRDLKPANVIIEEGSGRPRVIDFGLAKDATAATDLTGAGQILGTPYYLAPEQVEGRSHQVDARSDVFALGVILYECLTGQRPFAAKVRSEVYAQILFKEPVAPSQLVPGIPAGVDAACLRALAKKPEARFPSARDFGAALERVVAAAGAPADDESTARLGSGRAGDGSRGGKSPTGSRKRTNSRSISKTTAARRVPSEPSLSQARTVNRNLVPVLVGVVALLAGLGGLALRSPPEPREEPRVAQTSPSPDPGVRVAPAPSPEAAAPEPVPSRAATPEAPAPSPSPTPDAEATPDVPAPAVSPDAPAPEVSPAVPAPAPAKALDDGAADAREFPGLVEKNEHDWVARAFATNFHAAATPGTASSVRALRLALLDRHPLVRAFALRGLTLRTADDLRAWGGRPLFEGLVANLRATKEDPYLSRTAKLILATLAGKDAGNKEEPWRAWWKTTGAASFEAAASARPAEAPPSVAAEAARGEVATREREVTSYFTQAREQGLECAICLDVTDSMVPQLARVRREITQITSFFALLLPKKGRLALVTYGDLVKDVVPLTDNMRAFAGEVEQKAVLFHDPLDKTVEEGPDKALALCVDPRNTLGWRKSTRKVLVVMGDAPMHKPDEKDCFPLVERAAAQGWTLNAVIVEPPAKYADRWPPAPEFRKLAELGKGLAVELKDPKELITSLLVLTLGSKHEDDLRRFVVAYREVTGD